MRAVCRLTACGWSGIAEEALRDVTATFEEVQRHLLALLSVALRLHHSRCIDTAVLYQHPRRVRPLKPHLVWLTKTWCGRETQNRGAGGHDPEEDARAVLDLLWKKVDHGPGCGMFKVDFVSIFERIAHARNGTVTSAVVDHGDPVNWHGAEASATIACSSDAEVLAGLLGALPVHAFAFGRFTALAVARGWITNRANPDTTDAPPTANLAAQAFTFTAKL